MTKTARILGHLKGNNGAMDLNKIYQLMNVNSLVEKKQVRGLLTSLKLRGIINNPDYGIWKII